MRTTEPHRGRMMFPTPEATMPRHFFDLIGLDAEMDVTGTDLWSATEAKREEESLIGALVVEGLLARNAGWLGLEVVDEAGTVLFRFDVTSRNASMSEAA